MEYMDSFDTPEAYIKYQACKNTTSKSRITKYDLQKLCDRYGEKYSTVTSKEQLFDLIVPMHISFYDFAEMYDIGIASIELQKKFDISGDTIRYFARLSLIDVVGQQEYTDKDGNKRKANLYDTYAYYRLTTDKIRKWLKALPKQENRKS